MTGAAMVNLFDILAARRPNIEGEWIEILIPVLIIIVYAISGILKMRSNLKEQQKTEQDIERPRYRPLDEESWERPAGEAADQESARLERMLEVKPMARAEPPVRRPIPARPSQPTTRQERRTLDAFLATQAPKPLAERIAEAQARAQALARAQAQQMSQKLGPHAAQRMQTAQTRKPKVAPSPAAPVARAQPPARVPPSGPRSTIAADLMRTDSLRKAILYTEILGAPLALRDTDV